MGEEYLSLEKQWRESGDVHKQTEQLLREIVTKVTGISEVGDETCLYHDLLIAGDDAANLLDIIHSQFGTRFDNLEFSAYFPDETEAFPLRVAKLFGYKSPHKKIPFRHLVKVVEEGQWFDP